MRDRRAGGALLGTAPVLDETRTAHLAQAREAVRTYTAAAHSGCRSEARQLLDASPVPARALSTSGPAAAWRESSATAQDAVEDLSAQRAATAAEDSADPDLLHAATSYLAARGAQLHLVHDALGRLAFPAPVPRDLPEALAPVAAAQTHSRVIEAFGTLERAAQTLEGQIHYQLQQPVPAHRRATTGAESDLLNRALGALEHARAAGAAFDEEDIRARLQEVMTRPAPPPRPPQARRRPPATTPPTPRPWSPGTLPE